MDSYDEIPYPAMPLPRSHPGHLGMLGRMAGLHPAKADDCRVLELGCANGGNLIPMAARLPGSHFIGVERSLNQAIQGQQGITRLGLTNCQILPMDLQDFIQEGRFDYILAHGLYSWAPAAVRRHILSLCDRYLAPHGLALISFNTLPGWHLRGVLREMLLEQTRHGQTPMERLTLAQTFLTAYLAALAESDAYAARHLVVEIRRLLNDDPAYLFHEYLEEENHPLLFRTFAEEVRQHNLQFVCDADPAFWSPAALEQQGETMLDTAKDPLEREQLLDFLMLRNFREAVLCRQDQTLTRPADLGAIEELAVFSSLRPPPRLLLHQNQGQVFVSPAGDKLTVSHPLSRAALGVLWEHSPAALPWPALCRQAAELVHSSGTPQRATEWEHLAGELFSLFLRGEVGLTQCADPLFTAQPEFPKATALAKLFIHEGWLPTMRHAPLPLTGQERQLFNLLDGSRDFGALAQTMLGPDAPPNTGKILSHLRRLHLWVAECVTAWARLDLLEKS